MTLGLSADLSTPFFTGPVQASVDTPWYLPVSLGGRPYLIDTREYRRQTVPTQKDAVDDGAEPADRSLSTVGSWRRNQHDFRGGAGQEYFDFSQDDARDRFWSSKGVDVLGTRVLRLLPDTRNAPQLPSSDRAYVYVAGGYVYYWSEGSLQFTGDPSVAEPVLTDVPITGDIQAVVTDGSRLFVATFANGIYQVPVGTDTASAFSSFDADGVWFVNGRLLASFGPRLVEVAGDGTAGVDELLDFTHRSDGWVWTEVVGGANYILAGGHEGGQGAVFAVGLDESGTLIDPFAACTLPRGELLFTLEQYTSTLLLGTSRGIRMAEQQAQGAVQYGPVVEVGPVYAMEGFGEFVYFGWSNYDDTCSGLGKADLSRFTEPLVPAYASHLMAEQVGSVRSIEKWGDGWMFTVDGDAWMSTDELVPSGTLTTSHLSFGTFELKAGRFVSVRHDPLHGQVIVSAEVETEAILDVGSSTQQGSLSPSGSWRLNLQQMERLQLHIELIRDVEDVTRGPQLRRWTASVIPTPQRVDSFLVPIVLHSLIVNNEGDGAEHYYDTLREFEILKGLETSRQLVLYQEGVTGHEVYIDGMEFVPEKWNDSRSFFEGLLYVRLLTSKPE